MVLTLAETLDVPLRERNTLLEAAGFAAIYRETPLDAPAMADVREALAHILSASEPNPTLIVNRRYDLLMANEAARRLMEFFARDWRGDNNVARMLLGRDGLRPYIENWSEVATHVVHRTRNELSASPIRSQEDEALLQELHAAEPELRRASSQEANGPRGPAPEPTAILVPMKLRRDDVVLDLFTTITTLGTPLDITLQELRVETLFPANAPAREALLSLVGAPRP